MYVAVVGILLNILVVLLNGAMPVGAPSGGPHETAVIEVALRALYRPIGAGSLVPVLGDVLPLPALGGLTLVSIGDVLLMLGVSIWLVGAMTAAKYEPGSGTRAS